MERELILEAKSGSRDAFTNLMKRYDKRVYYAAYSFLHNIEDASDVAQEVLLKVFKKISTFDHDRPLYPWLYRITRNLCINRINRSENKNYSLSEEELIPSSARTPEAALLRDEESETVRHAVSALPDRHREIIELKHFQDCSYAEISEILNIPIGTVMSRLYNARGKLKESLL